MMKKLFLIAMCVVGIAALAGCGIVDRFFGDDYSIDALNPTDLPEIPVIEPAPEPLPAFVGFSGIVKDVSPFYEFTATGPAQVDGKYFLLIEYNDDRIVFLLDEGTTRLTQISPGTAITGFFDTSHPIPINYPPQYHARVLMPASAFHVMVDRFDENFRSSCGNFTLNISEDTQILRKDSEPFYGMPTNQILIVEFEEEGFNITPVRITALFEQAIHPTQPIDSGVEIEIPTEEPNILVSHFDERLRSSCESFILIVNNDTEILYPSGVPFVGSVANRQLQVTYEGSGPVIIPITIVVIDAEETLGDTNEPDGESPIADGNLFHPVTVQIIINGNPIGAATPFVDSMSGAVMVPIVAIAIALDYSVEDNDDSVTIGQSEPLLAGVNSFGIGRMASRPLSTAPIMRGGVMFVPWEFFTELLNGEKYIQDGNIVINA